MYVPLHPTPSLPYTPSIYHYNIHFIHSSIQLQQHTQKKRFTPYTAVWIWCRQIYIVAYVGMRAEEHLYSRTRNSIGLTWGPLEHLCARLTLDNMSCKPHNWGRGRDGVCGSTEMLERSCWTPSCHYNSPKVQTLGTLHVRVSKCMRGPTNWQAWLVLVEATLLHSKKEDVSLRFAVSNM